MFEQYGPTGQGRQEWYDDLFRVRWRRCVLLSDQLFTN
jgi:hypothetical protein